MQVAQLQLDEQRVDAATSPASTRELDEVAGPTAVSLPDGRAATSPRSATTERSTASAINVAAPVAPTRRRTAARRQVTAPDVVGLSAVEAISAVRGSGLTPVIEQHETAAPDELGLVLLQEPPADAELVRGSSLELWVGAEKQQTATEFPTTPLVIAAAVADEPPVTFDRDRAYVDVVDDGWFALDAHEPDPADERAPDTLAARSEDTSADAHAPSADALGATPSADPPAVEIPVADDGSREQRAPRRLRLPRRRAALMLTPLGLLLVCLVAGSGRSAAPPNSAASGAPARPIVHARRDTTKPPRQAERRARTRVVVRSSAAHRPRPRPRAVAPTAHSSTSPPSAPAPAPAAPRPAAAPSAAPPPPPAPPVPAHPARREFFTP